MLDQAQIDSMRQTVARTFADEATIYRKTTENIGGEEVATWSVLATVPCRIAPMTSRARGGEGEIVGGRIAEETTHLVTLAAKTDIDEADVIAVDDTAYQVTLIRKRGSWELSRRVEVKESVEGIPEVEGGSSGG